MTTGERIKDLRRRRGMNAETLAAACGVSPATMYRYEKGEADRMPASTLKKISEELNTTTSYLLGFTNDPYGYEVDPNSVLSEIPSAQRKYLLHLYDGDVQKVSDAWQRAQDDHPVFDFTDDEILDDSKAARARGDLNREPPNVSPFPTVSEMPGKLVRFKVLASVHAGYNGIAREEVSTDVELVPLSELRGHKPGEYRVLRIEGTSMYPMFLSGDRVLVHCQPDIENGEVAVVIYNGDEATVKKVYKGHGYVELLPINPEYPPKRIEGPDLENFRVFGKVVRLMRNINA